MALGTNPNSNDTDQDGILDPDDAVPNDPAFTHARRPVPQFAVITLPSTTLGYPSATRFWKVNDLGQLLGSDGVGNRKVWSKGTLFSTPGATDINNVGQITGVTPSGTDRAYARDSLTAAPATLDVIAFGSTRTDWVPNGSPEGTGTYILDSGTVLGKRHAERL